MYMRHEGYVGYEGKNILTSKQGTLRGLRWRHSSVDQRTVGCVVVEAARPQRSIAVVVQT